VPGGHQKRLDKSQTEFFAGSRNSMEATEDDERRKHGQSKSDFRKLRFDKFHWQELWPIDLISETSTSSPSSAWAKFSSMALSVEHPATMVNGTKDPVGSVATLACATNSMLHSSPAPSTPVHTLLALEAIFIRLP